MLLQSTVGTFSWARLVLRPLFCNESLPYAAFCYIFTLLSLILFQYCRLLVVNGLAFIFYQIDGELPLDGRREILPLTILGFELSLSYDSLTFISLLLRPLDDRIFSCLCLSGDYLRFSLLKPFAILMFVTTPTSPLRILLFYCFFQERLFVATSILSVLFKNELIFYQAKKTSCGMTDFLSPNVPDFARGLYLLPFMKRFILQRKR